MKELAQPVKNIQAWTAAVLLRPNQLRFVGLFHKMPVFLIEQCPESDSLASDDFVNLLQTFLHQTLSLLDGFSVKVQSFRQA